MNTNGTINLLRKSADDSVVLSPYEKRFQLISRYITLTVLGIALLTFAVTIILRLQERSLLNTRERLTTELAAQSTKEVLYHALKERIKAVAGVLENQKDWGKRFDLVNEIGEPPVLESFSGVADAELTVNLHVDSFEEVISLAGIVSNFFDRRDVTRPRVVSYSFNQEDGVSLTLGFRPVF